MGISYETVRMKKQHIMAEKFEDVRESLYPAVNQKQLIMMMMMIMFLKRDHYRFLQDIMHGNIAAKWALGRRKHRIGSKTLFQNASNKIQTAMEVSKIMRARYGT